MNTKSPDVIKSARLPARGWDASPRGPREPAQLYDLEADPLQERNVYADYSEVVRELEGSLRAIVQRFPTPIQLVGSTLNNKANGEPHE